MSWNLTTSGAAIAKAGANANSTIVASTLTLAKWCDQAEATLATKTRCDWVALNASSAITADYLAILDDTVSSMVGMRIMAYDLSNYTSRAEAQTMLDILFDGIQSNINVLKETNVKELMGGE